MPLATRTTLRWLPPLAIATCALAALAWSVITARASTEVHVDRGGGAPALDWNDDGAFVVDPSGAPVVGAHVVAQPKTALGASHVSLRTDERGHFRLSVPSVYDIWIGADLPSDRTKPPRLFAALVDVAPPFHGRCITAAPPQRHRVPVRFADGRAAPKVEIRWFNRLDVDFIDQLDLGPVWGGTQTDERGDLELWAAIGTTLDWEWQEPDETHRVTSLVCPGARIEEGYGTRTVNSGSLTFGPTIPAIVIDR